MPAQPGKIETPEGKEIGEHMGLMYHTLGQRKGLHIGGQKGGGGNEAAWYVAEKDLKRNVLIAVQGADHPLLKSEGLLASQLHWVDRTPIREPMKCSVKTRYRQQDIPCTIIPVDDENIKVIFDEPQVAVTPGQSAVFYKDDVCLGGGIIEKRI
ncbi:tRNA-specific 2-thiouridylase mnmA [Vibrio ishigakensis]|uniref:tRNA-uridine 2-sulfurtransferase n=1 Tax=Vibrio ishigakensis TaxID=1481914 RepID=A0A0B8PCK3_9VIBR|nr:tRNA-specific 2-thiouridylase mnmA [Vibrio ishigakensis]GAM68763.1 tRNA-specific 2-thiouridylase mnmA [Vibrio sp. JCM 19236]